MTITASFQVSSPPPPPPPPLRQPPAHLHQHHPPPPPLHTSSMESGSLIHPASLPFYPTITSSAPILPASPGVQDSVAARSALAVSGQNGWGNYGSESLVPQHSCSMSSYSNLQLGASFSAMNSKAAAAAAYNSFAPGGDYFNNCRQISQLGSTLNSMSRYHPSLYGDMYQTTAGHPPTYSNGPFYPDMTPGLHPLTGRELSCSSNPSDSSSQGE
ncbi:hypothetical protein C0Q70_02619 [Pomacea canaliculata]|uniref:Uncharacterized protein n=1 Tax=Pomacea canaliculata TaxID=400727 RepID=A0A2T7PQF2_POMCA|nr:hypothetical protein C0Q70_02619 [Pomacea canaliculata]